MPWRSLLRGGAFRMYLDELIGVQATVHPQVFISFHQHTAIPSSPPCWSWCQMLQRTRVVGAPQGCGTASQTRPLLPSLSQEGSPCAAEQQQLLPLQGRPLTPHPTPTPAVRVET